MQSIIKKTAADLLPADSYEYGFADMSGLLASNYKKFHYAIALIRKLDDEIIDEISDGPTLRYYNYYHEINNKLNEKVEMIASLLESEGIQAMGIKSTVEDKELGDDYHKTLRYNFSHKMAATRAGLGWIGKTDLFISKKHGPRVRLASILINSKVLPENKPIDESLCGSCSVCVDSCPAKAANGKLWNISVDRNEFFDPFKCRENCRKLSQERINKNISLCGICVSVCPKGR